jgi:light-regulated signal transduction histidine kinase (bacteriophytochrome)
MDRMRLNVKWLQLEISKEGAARFDSYRELTRATFLFFLFGTLVMLIVMVWLYNSFIGYMQARDSANAELHRLNQELEHRISDRTKELQEFNEELQQFAYVASHDLQEPLRTITSFSQLLAARYRGKIDDDANEFLDYIVNSAHRMSDLLNGLLTLLRLRKAGQMSPVPLDSLIEDAKVSLQAAIRESGAQIEAGPLPTLAVDPMQFGQVLQNLISNAIKYRRDDETPVIRITARRDSTNWIIAVEDNGRGFDPQFAERIFGLFQRLNVSEVGGTGMGLTIVRRIVERHGGRVWAESKEGVGSTFYVSLPASLECKNLEAVDTEMPEAALPRSGVS